MLYFEFLRVPQYLKYKVNHTFEPSFEILSPYPLSHSPQCLPVLKLFYLNLQYYFYFLYHLSCCYQCQMFLQAIQMRHKMLFCNCIKLYFQFIILNVHIIIQRSCIFWKLFDPNKQFEEKLIVITFFEYLIYKQ